MASEPTIELEAPRAPVYSATGERTGDTELPPGVFGIEPSRAVMHQALLRQLANARQGTHSTKTRGEVHGSTKKPYRQKGTGRARHGAYTVPGMVGGGIAFGPTPRDYTQRMPRKMRRLALRSGLTIKAAEGQVAVLEGFELEAPKTRAVSDLLMAIAGENGSKQGVLVVVGSQNQPLMRSMANLPWARLLLASNLNLQDLFRYEVMVVTREGLEVLDDLFADPYVQFERLLEAEAVEAGAEEAE